MIPEKPCVQRKRQVKKMEPYKLGEMEQKFADLIWEKEPVSSGELTRLTYTSSSPYEQGSAAVHARFPGLHAAVGRTLENCEAAYFLALQTDFLRQRNRLLEQMKQLVYCSRMQLRLWKQEGDKEG